MCVRTDTDTSTHTHNTHGLPNMEWQDVPLHMILLEQQVVVGFNKNNILHTLSKHINTITDVCMSWLNHAPHDHLILSGSITTMQC